MKDDFLVLFVFPNRFSSPTYSPSIGAISSVLKQNGIRTDLIHINKNLESDIQPEKIADKIIQKNPSLVGFTATSLEYNYAAEIAQRLKEKNCKAPLICGGPHATLCPEDFENSPFDIWCRGEGELPTLELVQKMINKKSIFDIHNLYFKRQEKIIKNRVRKYINLDEVPFYDREIFDMHKLLPLKSGWIDVFIERGCPFECSYCCNHAYNKIYRDETGEVLKYRQRNVQNAISGLKQLVKSYGNLIKVVNFQDDLFGLDKAWLKEFCTRYRKEIGIPFSANIRVGLINEQEMGLLKEANCFEVRIGLESGSEFIREKVLNRKMSNEKIKETFALAKKYGLNTFAYCMVGMPEEAPQHIMETIKLLSRIKPRMIRCAIFFPFRGTRVYDFCRQKNYITEDGKKGTAVASYFDNSVLNLNTISRRQILKFHRFFGWFVNSQLSNELSKTYKELIKNLSSRIEELHFKEIIKEDEVLFKKFATVNYDFYHVDRNSSNWLLHTKKV